VCTSCTTIASSHILNPKSKSNPKSKNPNLNVASNKLGVPKLGYMYP